MSHLPKPTGGPHNRFVLSVTAEAELRSCMVSVLISIGTAWIGLSLTYGFPISRTSFVAPGTANIDLKLCLYRLTGWRQ
jgi:hypothetical protein